jgi:hypothetical protein
MKITGDLNVEFCITMEDVNIGTYGAKFATISYTDAKGKRHETKLYQGDTVTLNCPAKVVEAESRPTLECALRVIKDSLR